ncbi:MAG TPA: acetyl-CoA C-acyltransferase, partial [Candidatus Dormibacteraeota bacterium]|nr:acetyl-CoA C-acyltransferase [Candidatus Dormibacteraeota bacterium]
MSVAFQSSEIVVLAGARTPFGNLGGAVADLSATDLAVAAAKAAIERSGVAPEAIDEVVFGNVIQT